MSTTASCPLPTVFVICLTFLDNCICCTSVPRIKAAGNSARNQDSGIGRFLRPRVFSAYHTPFSKSRRFLTLINAFLCFRHQKEWDGKKLYDWFILAVKVNYICFLNISISQQHNQKFYNPDQRCSSQSQQKIEKQMQLDSNISIIIPDFLSWIPFITVALLHFLEVLDATPWSSYLSIVILPVNS